jgi:hypothetical protein
MKLTAFSIQKAKPRDKPYRLPDGHGLALQIEPSGSMLWRFRYRYAGKANIQVGEIKPTTMDRTMTDRTAEERLVGKGEAYERILIGRELTISK